MIRTATGPGVALLMLLCCADLAPAGEDPAREAVAALLAEPREAVLDYTDEEERVLANPRFTAVAALKEEAIPLLIGALVASEDHERLTVVDAALVAAVSGAPPERIVPLGAFRRSVGGRDRAKWLDWYRRGCPLRTTVPGERVPTVPSWCVLRPPPGWPPAAAEPEGDDPVNRGPRYVPSADRIDRALGEGTHARLAAASQLTMEHVLRLALARAVRGMYAPDSRVMELIERTGQRDPAAREVVLLLLDRWGSRSGIPDTLVSVGWPEDAIHLDRAIAGRGFEEHSGARGLFRNLTALLGDAAVARGLLGSDSEITRSAALAALVRLRAIEPAEVVRRLAVAGPRARRGVYDAIEKEPAAWVPVLLGRLDDTSRDLAAALRKGIGQGGMPKEEAGRELRRLYASPHFFVRFRTAEAMLAVDRDTGVAWLRAELATHRTWNRMGYRLCTGEKGGLEGHVERLIDPPPDPYDTVGPEVALPPGSFGVTVNRIPFQPESTFVVRIANDTGEVFVRYPNYRVGIDIVEQTRPDGFGGMGGRGSFSNHPRLLRKTAPGEVVLRERLTFPPDRVARIESLSLSYRFVLPGRKAARLVVEIPAERLACPDDLTLFIEGLRSDDAWRSLTHGSLFSGSGGHSNYRVKDRSGLSAETRRGILDALLDAAEAADDPTHPDVPPFAFSLDGMSFTGTNPTPALLRSIRSFGADLTAADIGRLLRLRTHTTPRLLRRWPPSPAVTDAIGEALDAEDPLLIRNTALVLHARHFRSDEFRERVGRAVARWLASEDPLIRQAGLHAAARLEGREPPRRLDGPEESGEAAASRPPRAREEEPVDSPVLDALRGEPLLMGMLRRVPPQLVAAERERLSEPGPPSPGEYYRRLLSEAVRTGNFRSGETACLPLAFEEDEESIALLTTACGAKSAEVRIRAAFCLLLRAPERGKALLPGILADHNRRERRDELRELVLEHCPGALGASALRPLPPALRGPESSSR